MKAAVPHPPGRAVPSPVGGVHEQEAERAAEGSVAYTAAPTDRSASAALVDRMGPGRRLPEPDRSDLESRFGAGLADVRVHTGEAAHRAAESLDALAFTAGPHVGFRAGRFAPGTVEGQRLLAHEITHVLQQRRGREGTGSGVAVQRQPVAGESGTTALSGPPPPTGEQVHFHGVTLSQNPAQLRHAMEQMIIKGRPMPLGNSLPPGLGALQSFRFELNHNTFAQVSEDRVCRERPADDEMCRLALKIRPILDPILDDLERSSEAEVSRFRDAARRNTVLTLEANARQARAELVRYGITEETVRRTRTEYTVESAGMDIWSEREVEYTTTEPRMGRATAEVTGLQNAARVLLERRQVIGEKQREQASHAYSGIPGGAGLLARILSPVHIPDERYFELAREIGELKKGYGELQDVLGAQYPALAAVSELDKSAEGIRTLAAGAGPEMAALVAARVGRTLADIDKVCRGLWDDVNVWRLPDIVKLTRAELGIQPGTLPAALVDEKVEIEKPGILNDLAVGALNVFALLLAGPTGGLSLAAVGLVNVAVAAGHVEEYLMAKALYGSALDQAKALSHDEPSLFWLAVEIVGVGVGDVPAVASAAYRTFRVLGPLARTAVAAKEGKEAARALAELRLTAEGLQDATLADNLVARVGELRGGRASAMAVDLTDEEARLLSAGAKAVESEAARTIAHGAAITGDSSVTLSRAGWLFDCSSPCTIIRQKFAGVLGGDPARVAELAALEQRGVEAAAALDAARALDPAGEAAREAERVATAVSDDAAAFVSRLHDAYPHTRVSVPLLSKVADARDAFGTVLARRPRLSQELDELHTSLAAATRLDPGAAARLDDLHVRLAQLKEIDAVSQAPPGARIVEISADKAAAHYFENVASTVPGPPVVLEFPDGSRVWRETAGGPIRHEATLGESAGRAGMERAKHTATQHGNLPAGPRYERAHSLGQGTGFESPYAILYAPEYVNQTLQNRGIETFLRDLAASAGPGETFRVVTTTTAHSRPKQTLRLATMDYTIVRVAGGKAEEVATYSIRVSASADHPLVTAGALTFSPTAAGQAVAGRVPLPDVISKPASFAY